MRRRRASSPHTSPNLYASPTRPYASRHAKRRIRTIEHAPFSPAQHVPHIRSRRLHIPDGGCNASSIMSTRLERGPRTRARHLVCTDCVHVTVNSRELACKAGNCDTPVHRQLLLVPSLDWAVLRQALNDLYRAVELCVYERSRIHFATNS